MFEISLVPDIKKEAIKAQKLRNLILFICIVVSAIAIGVVAILFGIKGGQDVVLSMQEGKIKTMSEKMNSFESLGEFLTIQDELGNLSTIAENQQSASRTFEILGAVLPQGPDSVTLSEMTLKLSSDYSTLNIEGQANAGEEPYIDYRVLESFKKSLAMATYDYGEYVDKEGLPIPSMCLTERDESGNMLIENGSYYAMWYKDVKSCDPSNPEKGVSKIADRDTGRDEKIYRTPQFDDWYKNKKIDLDGEIKDVAHFKSQCKTYKGTEVGSSVRWDTENENCLVAPDGFMIDESSNGRDQDDQLVLRFSGSITIDSEVFKTRNNFMMISGPTGQNVTDSYAQIESMFASRAKDCLGNDTACQVTPTKTDDENGDENE